ncbi:hypothetical protein C4K23_1944 [Pseudomonas chlororaphis]|nr:hypothetical protein C4K23_1944 [Pseudomonas chlororaphis]
MSPNGRRRETHSQVGFAGAQTGAAVARRCGARPGITHCCSVDEKDIGNGP